MARKLIEVALPLEEINVASAREKSIRHGHPSTLHLWWARRPLAAARAVIFASLITDPSDPDYPWLPEDDRDVEQERERLHDIIRRMVPWEASNDERILAEVHAEIHRHTNGNPPPLLDPFAGGGAIPLEAQRLGLEAHASDLNPVAVLINKAMIEIPPKFAGMPPVNPERQGRTGQGAVWKGATGLADDVRYYGKWMRDEAERRIGHLYPKVTLPPEQGGGEATVIAWLWARTVTCPNPACGAEMPLVRSFVISKKKGNETYVEPVIRNDRSGVDFIINKGKGEDTGTVVRTGAKCAVCGEPVPLSTIRAEAAAGRMSQQLMAVVSEGNRGRLYSSPDLYQTEISDSAVSDPDVANTDLPGRALGFRVQAYGMTRHRDLFTERQLVALTTFSDLVGEARERVLTDALAAGRLNDPTRLANGGTSATAYADAVATYLSFAVDRLAESLCKLSRWQNTGDFVAGVFGRQAISMVWDFAEVNPFSNSTRNFGDAVHWVVNVVHKLPAIGKNIASQNNAMSFPDNGKKMMISTDPPYYDNIGYADLSDFFYVWMRRSMVNVWSSLFFSQLVPKEEELIANPFRFDGKKEDADAFFERGFHSAFGSLANVQTSDHPLTIYYAFKQSESEEGSGLQSVASTGWETMLEGLVDSGYQVLATWPVRTERGSRMRDLGSNALATSVVLACRVRPEGAPEATRQQFVRELRQKLADDLRPLQQANIAPVDLAQAAIGPGMAIYSKYSRVREASGDALRVRGALALINQALDEVLAEQDEEYDNATRWAISWYESFGMNEGPFGDAEGFARARAVAVGEMAREGLVKSGQGKVRFIWREEYPVIEPGWHPRTGDDVYDWVIMQRLAQAIQEGQTAAATVKATIDQALPGRSATAHDLAYRLFNIAERKGWTREALAYNTLIQNWSEIDRLAAEMAMPASNTQLRLGE